MQINNYHLRLVTVYAPNIPCERSTFFRSMQSHLNTPNDIILTGDFNCVDNTDLDKCGGNVSLNDLSSKQLVSICNAFNLFVGRLRQIFFAVD